MNTTTIAHVEPTLADTREVLLMHARSMIAELGSPGDYVNTTDDRRWAERLDEAASLVTRTPTVAEFRTAALGNQSEPVRQWLAVRFEYVYLLDAVHRHDALVAGDLDLWDEFEVPRTDTGRAVALATCETDIDATLTSVTTAARTAVTV